MRITLPREPDFFASTAVEGQEVDVVVACEKNSGAVVGLGVRTEKDAFVNGAPNRIGYLGGLRIAPGSRGGRVLFKGYRLLRKFHRQGRARLYLTTIMQDNRVVRDLLSSGRAGLPAYRDLGTFHTRFLNPGLCRKLPAATNVRIRLADESDLTPIVSFLRSGSRRQFYPCYRREDFEGADGLLRGIHPGDILLAEEANEIVGTLAVWDQTPFKQSRIESYSGWLRCLRTLYNVYARGRRMPTLPVAGQELRYGTQALVCISGDNPEVYSALLREALMRMEASGHLPLLAAGLHERDPLLPVLKSLPGFGCDSQVYVCHWPDGEEEWRKLDRRPPYIELGAL